jgi:hypothetical protein
VRGRGARIAKVTSKTLPGPLHIIDVGFASTVEANYHWLFCEEKEKEKEKENTIIDFSIEFTITFSTESLAMFN